MKRQININKTTISSEEILNKRNFDELYLSYQANAVSQLIPKKPFYKSGWFIGGIATLTFAIVTTLAITNQQTENPSEKNENVRNGGVIQDHNEQDNPFINPPLKEVDVKKTTYIINANTGGVIQHFTGSKIEIKELCFTNNNGSIVHGDVEIEYREFHDQADIFFSGIPMNYDSADNKMFFESAGMIEINAYQNGEKLNIKPDKEITINMVSSNPDPKFNLYYLNEQDKKWDYIGKDKIQNPQAEKISEDGFNSENKVMMDNDLNTKNPLQVDCSIKKERVDEQVKVIETIKKDIKKIEATEPEKPKKATKDNYSFDIDVNPKEFPEMKDYSGMIFEAVDQKNFDPNVYEVKWRNIELKKQSETEYVVHLESVDKNKDILVIPVFEGQDYTKALAAFNKKFESYSQKLGKRKQDEKNAQAELENRKKAYAEAQKKWEEEREMQIQKMEKTHKMIYKANDKLTRIFKINKFGTWNCDSPVPRPEGKNIFASFMDETTGQKLTCISMCLVQKEMNAVFPLYQQNFSFDIKRHNILWGVTENGDIVVAMQPEFEKANESKSPYYNFNMKVIDPTNKSLEEIKEIIKA